ncbi:hypothetical protein CXG81DRAFT_2034, partial [Caulochytrium protostelioides]
IRSLLDNDLYKLTMHQAVWKRYPDATVRYAFKNRSPAQRFSARGFAVLQAAVAALRDVRLTAAEHAWLSRLADTTPLVSHDYVAVLAAFRFDPAAHIDLTWDAASGQITLWIAGRWRDTILYEIPLLALIAETYFAVEATAWTHDGQEAQAYAKAQRLLGMGAVFTDFGTRRRRDFRTHALVLHGLFRAQRDADAGARDIGSSSSSSGRFMGTSNVYLAMVTDTIPIGTLAHEWFMAHAVLPPVAAASPDAAADAAADGADAPMDAPSTVRHANRNGIAAWLDVFPRGLGVFLTDTYGSSLFFRDMDAALARQIDGLRHDSGDPGVLWEAAAAAFLRCGVDDLATKQLVFSDGLTVDRVAAILRDVRDWEARHARRGMRVAFGIGTHLTNDFVDTHTQAPSPPVNIVIKLHACNGRHVVKLSDDVGKHQGDAGTVAAV